MTDSLFTHRYRRLRQVLIDARKERGLSQEAVAKRLGRVQTYVSKFERGERRLDVIELIDVCEAIGLDPVKIVRELQEMPRRR